MGTVLQYTLVYCSEKGMRKAVCIAIQTGCAGSGRWASGLRALGHDTGRRARRARQQVRDSSGTEAWGAAGAGGLGVLLGQQAVHLVHSACF